MTARRRARFSTPTYPIILEAFGAIILWELWENVSDQAVLASFTYSYSLFANATANAPGARASASADYLIDAQVTRRGAFTFQDSDAIAAIAPSGPATASSGDTRSFTFEIRPGESVEWLFVLDAKGSATHTIVPLAPAAPFLLTGLGALALAARPRARRQS